MKKLLSLTYRLVLILTTIFGLYINFEHSSFSRMIVYYTILSNIACLVFFSLIFIKQLTGTLMKNNTYYIVKFSLTICIMVTMLAFELVIRPYIHFKTGYSASNNRDAIVHLIVPLMVIIDYLVFDEKGHFTFKHLPSTFVFPIAYTLFVVVYSNFGGTFKAFKQVSRYPYVFMDYDSFGDMVFIYCAFVLLVFVLLGIVLICIDKKLSKNPKNGL